MRAVVGVLVVALGVLGFFYGLRLGYLTLTPTWAYNARGLNSYTYRTNDEHEAVRLSGSCDTRGGSATLQLYAPSGRALGGQECARGEWSLNLVGTGEAGLYRLDVLLNHFTGRLEIDENR